jgi:glycosyltransferase involved in cell wall biosynthesis
MPKLGGMIRCKDGAPWISAVLDALLEVCGKVVLLDNHSTDATAEICRTKNNVLVIPSVFSDFDEARDKSYLFQALKCSYDPDWVITLDADEVLVDPDAVVKTAESGTAWAYRIHFYFLWNGQNTIRTDGVYGDFWRSRIFNARHTSGRWDGRIHCEGVPNDLLACAARSNPAVHVKHFGPMLKEDRLRKYYNYRQIDPNNAWEDDYAYSVLGDLPEFPTTMQFKHGGPLKLEAIDWRK